MNVTNSINLATTGSIFMNMDPASTAVEMLPEPTQNPSHQQIFQNYIDEIVFDTQKASEEAFQSDLAKNAHHYQELSTLTSDYKDIRDRSKAYLEESLSEMNYQTIAIGENIKNQAMDVLETAREINQQNAELNTKLIALLDTVLEDIRSGKTMELEFILTEIQNITAQRNEIANLHRVDLSAKSARLSAACAALDELAN
jgi:hypothetical protein